MRHRAPLPLVAMQPQPPGHSMRHSVNTLFELTPRWRLAARRGFAAYWQPMRPSTVAGAGAETLPIKIAHVNG